MENSINDIDKIIRGKLLHYEEDVSSGFWKKLNRRLSNRKVISGLIFLIAITTGGVFWMMNLKADSEIITTIDVLDSNNFAVSTINKQGDLYQTYINSDSSIDTLYLDNNTSINYENDLTLKPEIEKPKESLSSMLNTVVIESINEVSINGNIEYSINKVTLVKPNELSVKEEPIPIDNSFIPKIKFDTPNYAEQSISRFSISMEVGIDKPIRTLNSNDEFKDLAQYREDNESVRSGLSYGILFNYHYKNFTFSTGLRYSSIIESLNYNKSKVVLDPNGGYFNIDTISVIIYDENNNQMPLILGYNRTWIDEYMNVDYNVSSKNEYTYIDIPLKLSYGFNSGKFCIEPGIGASLGFMYKAEGLLPVNDSIGFVDISTNSHYLNKFIPSIDLGVNLEYRLLPNYNLYISPFVKHRLKSIYNQNYPLKSTFTNVGVRFGLRIYL